VEFKVQVTWQTMDDPETWYREVRTVRAVSRKHALDKATVQLQRQVPNFREVEIQLLTIYDLLNGGK
jgi:hypothetical protein